MKRIYVDCGAGYEIIQYKNCISQLGENIKKLNIGNKAVIVTDSNVEKLYLENALDSLKNSDINAVSKVINCGEQNKSLETVQSIYSILSENQFTRNDIVIALGGGIVGDIAGFTAATYMRGMQFVQVPTTIISQTDSSVGGKTGVNYNGIKNLIGCFYQPRLVLIDTNTLETLPYREYSAGMAEVIKYACICDSELYKNLMQDKIDLDEVIYRCCDIKRSIVEKDEKDFGIRHILNFGHTIGHAIETASYGAIIHGEAVAIGMKIIAAAGEKLGITEQGTSSKIECICRKFGLSCSYPDGLDWIRYIASDKKRSCDSIDEIFLSKIGSCIIKRIPIRELSDLF